MITDKQDRSLFIGGSEMRFMYASYNTKTFRDWWFTKLEGIEESAPPNLDMAVGTILEHGVIDLYEQINGVKGERDGQQIKGFARANTDLVIDDTVYDVKVTKHARKWHEKGKVPIHYKRQLIHYCYVLGLRKAGIIAYQCDDELKDNPFVELEKGNLFEIPVEITEKEITEHQQRIEYLEFCRDMGVYPS